jgi:hypothetical protein
MSRPFPTILISPESLLSLRAELEDALPTASPRFDRQNFCVSKPERAYQFGSLVPGISNPRLALRDGRLSVELQESIAVCIEALVDTLCEKIGLPQPETRYSFRAADCPQSGCRLRVFRQRSPEEFGVCVEPWRLSSQMKRGCFVAVPKLLWIRNRGLFLRWTVLSIIFEQRISAPRRYLEVPFEPDLGHALESDSLLAQSTKTLALELPPLPPRSEEAFQVLQKLPDQCAVCYEEAQDCLLPAPPGEKASGCVHAETTLCVDCVARTFLSHLHSRRVPTCSFCRQPIAPRTVNSLVKTGLITESQAREANAQ